MLFQGIISWKGALHFNGGRFDFQMGDFIFEGGGGVHPMGRDISFDGGGGFLKKNVGWGEGTPHASHPCRGELKKCPPPSAAVQRFVNVVRERKPR